MINVGTTVNEKKSEQKFENSYLSCVTCELDARLLRLQPLTFSPTIAVIDFPKAVVT